MNTCSFTQHTPVHGKTHSVGEAKVDEESEQGHVQDLASKVRDLNKKLEDIRKEQQFQREREHDFRNLSDKANSRALWWSILQVVVLLGTCYWQMTTLRVSLAFFPLFLCTRVLSLLGFWA